MTWVVWACSLLLAGVAAAGVLRPFGAGWAPGAHRDGDPLEDERATLLRSLRELDEEHATGQLTDQAHRALRRETEVRAVAVLRALEARDGTGEATADLRSLRGGGPPNGDGAGAATVVRRRARGSLAVLGAGIVIAVVAVALAGAIRTRSPGEAITGQVQSGLGFFEQRVAQHPEDVAARLDLAQRYLESGDVKSALEQYVAVLEIDPRSAEAHAQLGFILYEAGRAQDGLVDVQKALDVDPSYPEALYFKGVILLKGLDRPAEAGAAFRAYLDAAPFGAHTEEVTALLAEADREAAGGA